MSNQPQKTAEVNEFTKAEHDYAKELFALLKRGRSLEYILESAHFDLKSENVAKLIQEMYDK